MISYMKFKERIILYLFITLILILIFNIVYAIWSIETCENKIYKKIKTSAQYATSQDPISGIFYKEYVVCLDESDFVGDIFLK